MLRGLPSLLQRQHSCAGCILPRIQFAGFAKERGGDDDVGSDSNYAKALKARTLVIHEHVQTSFSTLLGRLQLGDAAAPFADCLND